MLLMQLLKLLKTAERQFMFLPNLQLYRIH